MKRAPANILVSLGQFSAVAASSLSTIVTARFLGPTGRGMITTLMSTTALASAVGVLGLPTLLLRHARRRTDVPVATAVLVAVAGTVTACLVIGTIMLAPQFPTFARSGFTYWMYLLAIAYAVSQVLTEAVAAQLQGTDRFALLTRSRVTWSVLPLLAVSAFAAAGATPPQSFVGFTAVALIVGTASMYRILGPARIFWAIRRLSAEARAPRRFFEGLRHEEIRSAVGTHVNLTLLLFVYRVDVVILAALKGPRDVGIYTIAYAAVEIVWMYVNGVSIVSAPRFVSATVAESRRLLRHDVPRALVVSTGILLLGVATGPVLISSLLGSSYRESYGAFAALAPGAIAFVVFKLKATALNARARSGPLARLCGLLLIVNIAANFALIPRFGAVGAAGASSITYVLGGLLSLRLTI